MTIAAVNVQHDALLAAYEALPFPHSAEAPHHAASPASTLSHKGEAQQFHPGRHEVIYEDRAKVMGTLPDMNEDVIAAIAVPNYGCDEDVKKYALALITYEIYQVTVERTTPVGANPVKGVRAFYRPYASTGLIGCTLRGSPDEMDGLLHLAVESLPINVSEADVKLGRTRTIASFKRPHLETMGDYCDFIGTSYFDQKGLIEEIGKVTVADLEVTLSATASVAPAVYVIGSTFTFPKLHSLKRVK